MKTPTIYRGSKAVISLSGVAPGDYLLVAVDSRSRRRSLWCKAADGAVDASLDVDEKMSLGACSLILFRSEKGALKHYRNYYDAFTVGYSNSLVNGSTSQVISL